MTCAACGGLASHRHHAGAPSCKACSSFFRRTIGYKRMYKCRDDPEKCDDRRPNKHGCQACRLFRCLEAGMDVELIPFNESPQLNNGILQTLTRFWNANYLIRLQSLNRFGLKGQKSYFEFEKTLATCKGALFAETDVMNAYLRNCDTLIGMSYNSSNIEEAVRANFLPAWIAIEMVYRTMKNQGYEHRRVYFPDNSYLLANEVSLYHYYCSFGILYGVEIVAREGLQVLQSVIDASRRISELKVTEVEYSICSFLILMKITNNLDPSSLSHKKLLDCIFRELKIEYDLGKFDSALRIGDLMLTLDLVLNVKANVEKLLTCLSLHEKPMSNFFSAKVIEE